LYRELQTPSRVEANAPTPQVEEGEEDIKSQLTQSWVSEVRRDVVEVHRVGQRHPRLILQGESDIMLPKQIREFLVEPGLVANLEREAIALGQLVQKRFEPIQKFIARFERFVVEVAELQKERPNFSPSRSIAETNSQSSASQSFRTFSCVIVCGR
jgi:hypothetical protein